MSLGVDDRDSRTSDPWVFANDRGKGNEGSFLASMSAVQDEADEGPDLAKYGQPYGESLSDQHRPSEPKEELANQLQSNDNQGRGNRRSLRTNGVGLVEDQEETNQDENEEQNDRPKSSPKKYPDLERASSADDSLSMPDDTPSALDSLTSFRVGGGRLGSHSRSPTPSIRAFDRRFQARKGTPSLGSPRPSSPAFLNAHSRQSSATYTVTELSDTEVETPWEVVRWAKLRKMTGQAFSEVGKRQLGRPTCIAVAVSIALGTSKGLILVFDYNQNLKGIIGQGTRATESGAVTSISISADHSTVAGGHASGDIFTWELNKPAKPFLHIAPIDKTRTPNADGHAQGVSILHVGFLGIRHTALSSADDKGMAFSHLATRGMGVVARSVKTTRVLGRYPEKITSEMRQKKPSSVLAFSTLPLGNSEHTADSMGLVAMITPYLLVVVSTMPIAQTQFKTPRSKDVAPHGTMTAALAWFPSVKLKTSVRPSGESRSSRAKLVYCWSNILSVLEVVEIEPSDPSTKSEPASLQFRPRSKWKATEAIVAVQWLSRSVLSVLTITQQLIILEDISMVVTDFSDLIQKHIYHKDLFSRQLDHLVDQLDDEEVAVMHGVVADAFYMSFKAYKGRLFLLGHNEVSFGTLSNWADRLMALIEEGSYISAIRLATDYYMGRTDRVTVGLPEEDQARHAVVRDKVLEMMLASLRYCLGKEKENDDQQVSRGELDQLASSCMTACISIEDNDFLFEEVFIAYQDARCEDIFIEQLESFIDSDQIVVVPPVILKGLVEHYTAKKLNAQLEEMVCHLDPRNMDIDQITTLCKSNRLYDALLYVWSRGLRDFTTVLNDLLALLTNEEDADLESASKIFPYLSYTLTGRVYPTGKTMEEDDGKIARAEIYAFFFSGAASNDSSASTLPARLSSRSSFPHLRKILDYDAPSFFSMLNEAFEDSFLNAPQERLANEAPGQLTEEQRFGLSVNRQWIASILLEVVTPPDFNSNSVVYLDMFVARNLPKFSQFILLPESVLHRILIGLCEYSNESISDDCELSVEYLLSIYQSPDLESLIPLLRQARFYRVLKSIYRSEKQYAKLLGTCFEDYDNQDVIFDCISECFGSDARLNEQSHEVRRVIADHALNLVSVDVVRSASAIDLYAPELHDDLLKALIGDDLARYQYLRTILEPIDFSAGNDGVRKYRRDYIENYVQLLCEYNPSHVSQYIEHLNAGELRLNEVLPALEEGGAVDAAVILMAREGKAREGIDRLTQHLQTLGSALFGLIEGLHDSPDPQNSIEAGQDLAATIQKYARVGVWLCREQTKSARSLRTATSKNNAKKAKTMHDDLSADEELWLDLIDTIVATTKDTTEALEKWGSVKSSSSLRDGEGSLQDLDPSKMITDLRNIVQETFTALLAATTPPRTEEMRRTDAAFLRILRAFLTRASLSSPSLSNLRNVLGTIFSAYSYEESLLSLSNRLLDKDLFVHVTEADQLRRRGWRPLGQVCEGCGRRVWGPGAGVQIWDAWQAQNEERERRQGDGYPTRSSSADSHNGKGKTVSRNDQAAVMSDDRDGRTGQDEVEKGPVVIFSCRHMFHRRCLENIGGGHLDETADEAGPGLVCPLKRWD